MACDHHECGDYWVEYRPRHVTHHLYHGEHHEGIGESYVDDGHWSFVLRDLEPHAERREHQHDTTHGLQEKVRKWGKS